MANCTIYFESESNFSEPMPWIGLYIAAASLACAMLIFVDVVSAIRYHQAWFPSRYFSLNATSLTIIGVATKLSVDLNTSMPGRIDQLAKLSTSVLICISMGIFMPSLGKMGNTELVTNLIALVILVITITVNLCIQLKTGVIYTLRPRHIILLGSMVYLLMVYCSTAIALASIKNELQVKYDKKHSLAVNEFRNESSSEKMTKRLKKYLMKFSMMAFTGWPFIVLVRSGLGNTTAFISIVDLGLLLVTAYTYLLKPSPKQRSIFCSSESDYKWSTSLIICTQFFAALVGFIMWCPKLKVNQTHRNIQILSEFRNGVKLEGYWTQWLVEIKQRPFFLSIHNKKCRKFVHHAKKHFCNFLIAVQIAMVIMIKSCDFLYYSLVAYCSWALVRFTRRFAPNFLPRDHSLSTSPLEANSIELRPYILYLEGEEEQKEMMIKFALEATNNYIKAGKKEETNHVIEFLETSLSHGFKGVYEFDSDQVCCLDSQEPPTHCWSLPVVTMTTIAILLPDIDACLKNKLLENVREGLVYVKIIEEKLNNSTDSINMRKASDIVWEQVEIHGRRLDINLHELAARGNHPSNILNFLVESAKNTFLSFKQRKETTSIWPTESVASNSLYRICQTILLDYRNGNSQFHTANNMFEMLSSRICDILGACLTNLEYSIISVCAQSTIENMNETVQCVLNLFARTEKVMELLDGRVKPNLKPDKLAFIDEWRCSSAT